MDKIELIIPSNPGYLQAIRLTTASLANKVGFDIDTVEDMKVVISEIVSFLIPINDKIEINFELYEDKIILISKADKLSYDHENKEEAKMKRQILMTLADDIQVEGNSISVTMEK